MDFYFQYTFFLLCFFFKGNSDQAIDIHNSWVNLQICKGKESWGAGNNIQLALSEKSEPYDYFLLGSDYGNIRVRYIYGFLENIDNNINRYITARGFEWTNKQSFIIGFSETIIYSGDNRSFDIGYLNPVSSHLEIELNNRLNMIGEGNANAVWQLHLDILLKNNLRFSANFLYDELVLDPDIQIGKEHGKAFSIRFAYTPLTLNEHIISFNGSFIRVGTPTMRHRVGANNFVQNGRPLGWEKGSDGQEVCIGLNYYNKDNIILNVSTGLLQYGDETITKNVFAPYSDYIKGPFPSGKLNEIYYLQTNISYRWRNYLSVSTSSYWSRETFDKNITFIISLF